MKFENFSEILNRDIFSGSKIDLIKKFADYPERYVGLFRPTKPKGKIIQNLTQSAEIKFGNAFEKIIEEYFKENKFVSLEKKFHDEKLNIDQLFSKGNEIFFIEQKVRDDHDSSKKRGQIDNFEKKLNLLQRKHPNKILKSFFYFIDDSLSKNRNYYMSEIEKLSNAYGITIELVYGKELFDKLELSCVWSEIENHLKKWKSSLPELPEINFEIDLESNFQELLLLELPVWRKIFSNKEIVEQMIFTVSPKKMLLYKLIEEFQREFEVKNLKIYKTLVDSIKGYI
jgi:hypothetical protein